MIYLFIAFGASLVGAISGLGGGVIIKPLLDILGHYDVSTINLLSSFTVLSMAIASTMRNYYHKIAFDKGITVLLAVGSIIGATLGDTLLSKIIELANNSLFVKQFQNILLFITLIVVLIYINLFKHRFNIRLKNPWLIPFTGLSLGFLSTLLGIGGGPINIMVLTLFFAMSPKEAAINSVLLILFSQAAKVFNVFFHENLLHYDLSMLLYMIPGGIIGGILGSKFNQHLSTKTMSHIFNFVLFFTILTTLYNIFI